MKYGSDESDNFPAPQPGKKLPYVPPTATVALLNLAHTSIACPFDPYACCSGRPQPGASERDVEVPTGSDATDNTSDVVAAPSSEPNPDVKERPCS